MQFFPYDGDGAADGEPGGQTGLGIRGRLCARDAPYAAGKKTGGFRHRNRQIAHSSRVRRRDGARA